ncbi:hypothetical protein ACFVYV_25135 [Streptomyces mirabilis]|uniref:hypothetical protein n=1 Tax=Streptomyces mirabilis TaxID=68239 RepID=UPI0036D85594
MSETSLPPVQPCTDPRHTGAIRERLGCVGPDPDADVEEVLRVQLAERVRQLEAARLAAIRAAAYRDAAADIDTTDDCDCGGCDSCIPRALADRLRARADEIEAAARIEEIPK